MSTVNLNEIEINGVKYIPKDATPAEQPSCTVIEIDGSECPYVIGQNYLVETCTKYFTGKLVRVTDKELILSSAAWVADTGKYSTALSTGQLNEVEMLPIDFTPIISRGAIVTVIPISFNLPNSTK
jgi:hypothetical protein